MARQKNKKGWRDYRLADGTRVPGVTTIISRFKESGGLIHWAWDIGRQGLDYRDVRDKAADAGTLAHAMVEAHIRGQAFDRSQHPEDLLRLAGGAYAAFERWAEMTKMESVETEVALVSEEYRVGGTLDAIMVQGELALGDWKTSNRIYQDYLIQLAAYKHLWEEHHPDKPITGGFHLLRFSKQEKPEDPIQFAHHHWAHLDPAWRAFVLMRELYDLDKTLRSLL